MADPTVDPGAAEDDHHYRYKWGTSFGSAELIPHALERFTFGIVGVGLHSIGTGTGSAAWFGANPARRPS